MGVDVVAGRALPILGALAVALSACGSSLPGAAAVVGQDRLPDSQLAVWTERITDQLEIPDNKKLNQAVISRWVVSELVQELADRAQVQVTEGQVYKNIEREAANSGGREELERQLVQYGILAEQLPDVVRTNLQVQALAASFVGPGDPQGQQSVIRRLQEISLEEDTQVSPRFGTWDAESLQVGDLPDDLSEPILPADPVRTLQ